MILRSFLRLLSLLCLAYVLGFALAGLVLVLLGNEVSALGSDLIGAAGLDRRSWAALVGLPVFGILLATFVARMTILRALGRML